MKQIVMTIGALLLVGCGNSDSTPQTVATDPSPHIEPEAAASQPAQEAPVATSQPAPAISPDLLKRASYCIGLDVGGEIFRRGYKLSFDDFLEGVRNAMGQGERRMTPEEVRQTMEELGRVARQRRKHTHKHQKKVMAENFKRGEAFLEANKDKAGVKALPSGLQYKVIREGTGKQPQLHDSVTVHYRGTLIDGKEFDSTLGKEPATFRVTGVIPGWTEGLQLMKEGAKWQLFVPSKLAYGPRGIGDRIPAHSALLFELELIRVEPK